jgi:hypothetical protein
MDWEVSAMTYKPNHLGMMLWRNRGFLALAAILALPLLLGAWKSVTSQGINRAYVERIQDGKTRKPEILTWFGDPQEIKRTPEGVVYLYQTFRAKSALPQKNTREIKRPPETPFHMEEHLKFKPRKQDPGQEPASSLTIRFQPDGETVQSHEYQEH